MDRSWLLRQEEGFWTGDGDFFRQHLAHDALMVFAEPVGVLTRERVIAEIANAPRWARVSLREVRWVALGPDAVLVSYAAEAERDGADPYRAFVSSAYVLREGPWQLAFHQQTPADAPP
jgi:hypothetical protein